MRVSWGHNSNMGVTWSRSHCLNMRVTCWCRSGSYERCCDGRLVLMVKGTISTSQMFLNGRVERKRSWDLSGRLDLLLLLVASRIKQMLAKLTTAATETSQ